MLRWAIQKPNSSNSTNLSAHNGTFTTPLADSGHISDLHISVYSKEGKLKILDGVDVETGYDFIKNAERRILGEENSESWYSGE